MLERLFEFIGTATPRYTQFQDNRLKHESKHEVTEQVYLTQLKQQGIVLGCQDARQKYATDDTDKLSAPGGEYIRRPLGVFGIIDQAISSPSVRPRPGIASLRR
jgi:hypothetical protein